MDFTLFFFKLLGALTSYVRTQLYSIADHALERGWAAEKSENVPTGVHIRTHTPHTRTPELRYPSEALRKIPCERPFNPGLEPSRLVAPTKIKMTLVPVGWQLPAVS